MKFQKGNTVGKGRPKGSQNKTGLIVKKTIANAIELSESRLMQELNDLTGIDYINAYTKLARYVIPTLQSQSIDMEVKKDDVPLWIEQLTDEDVKKIEDNLKTK